jgi:hypothetical protein
MARPRRDWVEEAIYHVYSRGSNRQAIFLNEGDYLEFETLFGSAVDRHRIECFG